MISEPHRLSCHGRPSLSRLSAIRFLLLLVTLAFGALLSTPPAWAASAPITTSNALVEAVTTASVTIPTYIVTTGADNTVGVAANCTGGGSSNCSLRDALAAAAANGAANIIFSPAVGGLGIGGSVGLYIPSNTTVTGPPAGLTVSGTDLSTAILNVNPGVVNAAISNVSFSGNSATGNGGGIYNDGQLTVTNSVITGNNGQTAYGFGAGIYNDSAGVMTLINSSVSANALTGPGTAYGGGIFNAGTMTVINSSILNNDLTCGGGDNACFPNYGAGIYNPGTLILTGSTVQGNSVYFPGDGGGIFNANGGILVVTNSNITGNIANYPNTLRLGNQEDDCDGNGCPASGTNGNTVGPPQNTQPPAATPVFSPPAGTYSAGPVTITDTTPGAIIFYSTNGTNWNRYVAPLTVTPSESLQAIAVVAATNTASNYTESLIANYKIPPSLARPVFSPPAGGYTSPQSVTISDVSRGTVFYYTTDGSMPTASSTMYTGPITVSSNETINAIAVLSGFTNSPVTSSAYIIEPQLSPPTFSRPPGTYTGGTLSISATPGATIYYTTNGTRPTTASAVYSQPLPFNHSATATVVAMAVQNGYLNSNLAIGVYYIAPNMAIPVFSLRSGTYGAPQMVSISDNSRCTIYYTTDGSMPTTSSTMYTGPITVSSSETIHAIAVASGFTNSPEATATYTISP